MMKKKKDEEKKKRETTLNWLSFQIVLAAMHNDVFVMAIQQWDNINRIKFPIHDIQFVYFFF